MRAYGGGMQAGRAPNIFMDLVRGKIFAWVFYQKNKILNPDGVSETGMVVSFTVRVLAFTEKFPKVSTASVFGSSRSAMCVSQRRMEQGFMT